MSLEAAPSGVRESARNMLAVKLDSTQLDSLFDDVLAITKQAWVSCKHCNKKSPVDIPDAKAVVSALSDLVTKIADLPKDAESGERIVFQRFVEMPPDEAA